MYYLPPNPIHLSEETMVQSSRRHVGLQATCGGGSAWRGRRTCGRARRRTVAGTASVLAEGRRLSSWASVEGQRS
ncbi:hypothetical protein DAI22_11g142350 [Oryza sativa Japonica Group]|nr:hypothetical protein DAI22_11g142350 [Oryza sativa Japonica Group]